MFSFPVNLPNPLNSIPRLAIVKSILGSSGPVCGVKASAVSIPASLVISELAQLDNGSPLESVWKR